MYFIIAPAPQVSLDPMFSSLSITLYKYTNWKPQCFASSNIYIPGIKETGRCGIRPKYFVIAVVYKFVNFIFKPGCAIEAAFTWV